MNTKKSSKEIKREIDKKKWEDISSFLYMWMGSSEVDTTVEKYYNSYEDLPFTLEEVLGVMSFMASEQIVIFDDEWKRLEIIYDEIPHDDEKNANMTVLMPVGYRIIPKIVTT